MVHGTYTTKTMKPDAKQKTLSKAEYQNIYNELANLLDSNPDYDDSSYGPVLVRLAWHASGTYAKTNNTGGSNGATMRFPTESKWSANAGLQVARDLLEPIKKKYGDVLSYSDWWSIGGVVGVQELGGPTIKWRSGRIDTHEDRTVEDGRLPDASREDAQYSRDVFGRMGFNDQELVALLGAHALGRCHSDRSGFEGPWTHSPTTFSNAFYKHLLDEKWDVKKWKGPKQYEDKATKSLMMLPTDMSLTRDKEFKKWVTIYANDEEKFFADFAAAYAAGLAQSITTRAV
ncbi:heme peroxidase [Powellomyces hirtus]|nr:heme peroxidase [Powellomyces hirtus]